MSGNSRVTTGSVWSIPSVSRPTTSPATLRSTRTSSTANVATHWLPLRRNICPLPRCSGPVDRRPETVAMQLVGVHLHALPGAGGHHRFPLVVHVEHQRLGLLAAVAEGLLKNPGHVRHEVHRIVPDDGHPGAIIGRFFLDLRCLDGSD